MKHRSSCYVIITLSLIVISICMAHVIAERTITRNYRVPPMKPIQVNVDVHPVVNSTPAPNTTHDTPPIVTQAGVGEASDLVSRGWIYEAILNRQKAIDRADLVNRINAFLANSPMANLGECMVANAERTGVWVMLCPAQAYAESSLGQVNLYPYQAWGMYGVHPSSWEDAIARYFDNIISHWGQAQDAHQLKGYCVPDYPYVDNVQHLAESI